MAQKPKRPPLARTVALTPLAEEKVAAIRRLTREIARIIGHFQENVVHAHDRRSALALERKRNRRGELLEALREQDPRAHVKLVNTIKESSQGGPE